MGNFWCSHQIVRGMIRSKQDHSRSCVGLFKKKFAGRNATAVMALILEF